MTLIDQRILISAPPEGVWRILSDPNQLSRWHTGYRGVSVLTTQAVGVGTRRRCTLSTGKDVIEEITAWVEGWGYEYHLVEGGPFRAFQGRFRLQAGPDGTSVQWTIAYQPKGLIGLIRDRLGGRRRIQDMMATSLRQLRRAVEELGLRLDENYRSRVAIRERLSADERAQYQRRYQSPEADAQPPILADGAQPEPSFVRELTGTASASPADPLEDTQPKPPHDLREAVETPDAPPAPRTDVPPEHAAFAPPPAPASAADTDDETIPDYKRVTPPRGIPSVRPSTVPTSAEPPAADEHAAEDASFTRGERSTDEAAFAPEPATVKAPLPEEPRPTLVVERRDTTQPPAPRLPPQTPKHDAGEISIWDVFGIRRPSEQDSEVLNSLMQSVQARTASSRLVNGRIPKRPLRVRLPSVGLGLRLRLALQAAGVRFRAGLRVHDE